MALVGLNVISIFKCKCHYKSHVLREILEKKMDGELFLPLGELYILCIHHAVRLQIATLAWSMLSTMAIGIARGGKGRAFALPPLNFAIPSEISFYLKCI